MRCVQAPEAKVDAVMRQADRPHALADAGRAQCFGRSVLQHAGADAVLHVLARARFQNNAVDALEVQEVRKQEASRPGADDANLGAHGALSSPPGSPLALPTVPVILVFRC